ncbi:Gfo/Idh/MocA family oxidoreductase [Litoribacter ruber]|uniref:Gfo/Idh/MocA family protein n=1 Tax=Litoribacter ruber TaxID=702568 RepID=UPI001BDA24F9|nr:Gfo/Idh/MocA family oxidoreductase [Litoribacter ruber]MBT0811618.1 Gfo/Idh/MocA family oxidoreductase [Litoribacter ruber]
MKFFLLVAILFSQSIFLAFSKDKEAVRLSVAGLAHGHSHWIFNDLGNEARLVGIFEPDEALKNQFKDQYDLEEELFFNSLEELLEKTDAEGVLAFGPIADHIEVVKAAAPLGIHVMVEKPLALNIEEARKMADLANKHGIHLLTNYETSWYPSTRESIKLLRDQQEELGQIRKAVFHHGHQGPKEIGVGEEFLAWLTDPTKSGGGALMDFGCYGANIMTVLMNGERPTSVTAITQTFKPETYEQVEDEATIILTYPSSQAIIQASWNWPISRKDMEIYTQKSQLIIPGPNQLILQSSSMDETIILDNESENPFSYFAKVIRKEITPAPFSLYSIENNLIVMEILSAARESAEKGTTIQMK